MRQRHPLPSGGFALVENAELEDNGCTGKVVGYSGCVGLSTNVGEVGDRLDLQVDLIARAECCRRCGRGPVMQGASGGRGPGLPIGGRATVLRWRKRRYRCASCARTFTETDPELPPRQRVTERFRRRLLGVSTLSISVFESEAGRPYAGLLQTLINTSSLPSSPATTIVGRDELVRKSPLVISAMGKRANCPLIHGCIVGVLP